MPDTADVASIIRDRAQAYGVDPAYLLRTAQVESGLDPNAGASTSSASGLFQFTKGTWNQYGQGSPTDPYANADAGARFTSDNARTLQAAGFDPQPGSLYLAHFAGPAGAISLLRADPSASASDVLGQAAVKANPFLSGMSVADVHAWAARKMGGAAPMSAPTASISTPPSISTSTGAIPSLPTQPQAIDPNDPAFAALSKIVQGRMNEQPEPVAPLAPIRPPMTTAMRQRLAMAMLGR